MWLIAGLGNPGRKYQRNRHSIGFRVIDELAGRHDAGALRDRLGGNQAACALSIGGRPYKVVLLQPTQFMNRSGFAVVRTAEFYGIAVEDIIVVHDEIDIDFGRIKLKLGGGHGGHNGVRSIMQELGSGDFARVRVGVGKPGRPPDPDGPSPGDSEARARSGGRDERIVGHVLGDFPSSLDSEVEALVGRSADAVEAIVSQGIRAAMNAFHASPGSPPDPGQPGERKSPSGDSTNDPEKGK